MAEGTNFRARNILTHNRCSLLLGMILLGAWVLPTRAQVCESTPATEGYRDYKFRSGDVTSTPTEAKPESKLWHNDGFWWGILWDPLLFSHRVYRLDLASQCWRSVGPDIDSRPRSSSDVLWDGQKLYVVSRAKSNHRSEDGPQDGLLQRFSYDSSTKTYSLDPGFPVSVNDRKSESLVLAKDGTGQLWVTWTQSHDVRINRSLSDDTTWGQPFDIPVEPKSLLSDDISSVIAFGGNKIGVMWSHQPDQKMYFSYHNDSSNDTDWEAREEALADPVLGAVADDHINLTTACTGDGTILAITKTSLEAEDEPKIFLLKRSPDGVWSRHAFSFGLHKHTRPMLLFNSDTRHIYVFARAIQHPFSIYYKSTTLDDPWFAPGLGTPFIASADDDDINDPTSTKQCVTNETGIVVLAADSQTKRYLHNYLDLNGGVNNQSPVAGDDQRTIFEDQPIAVDVLSNDGDPDGSVDPATLGILTQPSHGTVAVNHVSGVVTYTPTPDFSGTDIFTYRFNDNKGASSNEAIVTITVNEVNDLPVARDDAATTDNLTAVTITVLANDSDVDHDVALMRPAILSGPQNGSLNIDSQNGEVVYTPIPESFGPDTFSYSLRDPANGVSNAALVTIQVTGKPVAKDDSVTTGEEDPVQVDLLANDIDVDGSLVPATVLLANPAQNGATSLDSQTGILTYTPAPGFFGLEILSYTVEDDQGHRSEPARVTINVVGPPVAVNDSVVTVVGQPITIDLLANDFDPDNGTMVISSLRTTFGPFNGGAAINANTGVLTYSPPPSYTGIEIIGYKVDDNDGNSSNEGLVHIKVNTPPVAHDDSQTTQEDIVSAIDVTANDTDADGTIDPASVELVTLPDHGTLALGGGASDLTYTPDTDYFGPDVFRYLVRDNDGTPSNVATVSLDVVSVNDVPVALGDTAQTTEETSIDISIINNDFDAEGPVLPSTIAFLSQPQHGTMTLNSATGVVTYTPALNFFGSDGFQYTIHDDENAVSQPAGVLILVLNANDSPVAVTDSAETSAAATVNIAVTLNDFDIDNTLDLSSVAIFTPPGHGVANVLSPSGVIAYTPNPTFSGIEIFQYTVADDIGRLSNPADIIVRVFGPPVAVDDSVFLQVGETREIVVLANDSDPDGVGIDVTSVVKLIGPFNGSGTVNPATGVINYTPQPGFDGTDAMRYTVKDLDGFVSNEATVTITVGANQSPVANNDQVTTDEDVPVVVNVTANDLDPDGVVNQNSIVVQSAPQQGTFSVGAGIVTYTPNSDYSGPDAFTYTIRDGEGALSNTANVSISVTEVNDPPVVRNDTAVTSEETTVKIRVLDNDLDIDGSLNKASLAVVTAPAHGTTSADFTTGEISYTPEFEFGGTDSFEYVVADNQGLTSAPARVLVSVASQNDPPVALDDAVTTNEDNPTTIAVLANDSDSEGLLDVTSVAVVVAPSHGAVTVNASGSISFVPAINYFGADVFQYVVSDQQGASSAAAAVHITIAPVNDPPVAAGDTAFTSENTAAVIPVLDNDSDLDGSLDAGSVSLSASPLHGSASVASSGLVTYSPATGFSGEDTFSYSARDNDGALSNTSVVTVFVSSVNLAPSAVDDAASTTEGAAVVIDILVNDKDLDGNLNASSVALASGPAHGAVNFDNAGQATYSPASQFTGSDFFQYTVQDNEGETSNVATVSVDVLPANQPPLAVDDQATTPEAISVQISVLANDSDPDGSLDASSVEIVNAASQGTTDISVSGFITYTPASGFTGTDQFSYQVKDDQGVFSNTAIARVDVTPSGGGGQTLTFQSIEDGQVKLTELGSNYGSKETMKVALGKFSSFVKFNVAGLQGSVSRAILKLQVTDGATDGGPNAGLVIVVSNFYNGTSDLWSETLLTAGNAPAVSSNPVARLVGPVSPGDLVEFDVTTSVTSDGLYSFAIVGESTNQVKYYTRQGVRAPQLAVEAAGGGGNQPPTAADDAAATTQDQSVTIDVLANDADPDGSLVNATLTTKQAPSHGSATINSTTGIITYAPDAGFAGADAFTYAVKDNDGAESNIATVSITVTPANLPPQAADDIASTQAGQPVVIDVLSNDADADADGTLVSSSTQIVNTPANGSASVSAVNGEITYTPNPGFDGTDTFLYHVNDDDGATSNDATVTVTVAGTGGGHLTFLAVEDGQVKVTELGKNYGAKGTGKVESGKFRFYFKFNVTGVTGVTGLVQSARIRLTVTDGPSDGGDDGGSVFSVANTYAGTTTPWTEGLLNAGNAPNIGGSSLANVGQVAPNAVVEIDVTGAVASDGIYSFALKSQSSNQVKYYTKDGGPGPLLILETAEGGGNRSPIAQGDAATTEENVGVVINVLSNDSDPDDGLDASSLAVKTPPQHGTAVVNGSTGFVTYTPASGFSGTDSFTYTVKDASGAESNTATVNIEVTAASSGEFRFTAIEDGQVKLTEPGNNYGTKSTAKLAQGKFVFYLKFQVFGLDGAVGRAFLRVKATDGSSDGGPDGGSAYSVSNSFAGGTSPWHESTLTSGNAPAIDGNALSSAGPVAPSDLVELDVTAAVNGDGFYSFALANDATNQVKYYTREGLVAPVLIVEKVEDGGNQAPVAQDDAVSTPASIAVALVVLANDSDADGSLKVTSVSVTQLPDHGGLLINPNSGVITYSPDPGFSGTDSFVYTVEDDQGAVSNPATATVTVVGSGGASSLTFLPSDDAQVKVTEPGKNYGTKTDFKVEFGKFNSYLKFVVSGVSGSVQSATLRLRVSAGSSDGSADGGSVYLVGNDFSTAASPWSEQILTAGNAPLISGPALSSAGRVSTGGEVALDVTSAVAGNGTFSFGIQNASGDLVRYESRESESAPKLVVEFIASSTASGVDSPLQLDQSVDGDAILPEQFDLYPNYPNPFNASTTIEYALPQRSRVELVIFNTRGQAVRRLIDDVQAEGFKKVIWNGKNDSGIDVASGAYFLRLQVASRIFTRKLALQK